MPRYSVIIPFYKGLSYIQECVGSILVQGYDSFEVLVVDDCDPLNSGKALDALYADEPRVKLLHHAQNRGTLQARRSGVLASCGEYVLFADQDDTFVPGAFSALDAELDADPVDILHFAAHVVAENAAAQQAREGMQRFLMPQMRSLFGEDILKYQFAEADGFDWQVTHKVYNGALARTAWEALEDVNLSLADDAYANFVMCSYAKSYRAISGAWYEYHLGRGDTFGEGHAFDQFKRWCSADSQAYNAVLSFVRTQGPSLGRTDFNERVNDVCDLLAAHSMNELVDNLNASDWEDALSYASELWPARSIAAELWRFVRDRAYALLSTEEELAQGDVLFTLVNLAKRVDSKVEGEGSARYNTMRAKAFEHTIELERKCGAVVADAPTLIKEACYETQPVRIFVTTHIEVATFKSDILQPVQSNAAHSKARFMWAYQNDSGENIASASDQYCELTTQYWAWKNIATQTAQIAETGHGDQAEQKAQNNGARYFGFCHYRRYFNFSSEKYEENPWGEVIDNRINSETQARYGLDDSTMHAAIEGWDIITTKVQDVHNFPERYKSVYDHYKRAPHLKIEHLDCIISILEKECPDYADDAKLYLHGSKSCFCNMFIMREELFDAYCSWLFPLLQRFTEQWDSTNLSKEALRTPGHLSERLFNIWLMHEKRINPNLRHKELQCVHFQHPEPYAAPVLPRVSGKGKPVVPIVFAANDVYVPMLTTALYSLLKNASHEYFYHVIVLESDISSSNKAEMQRFFLQFTNAKLQFVCVNDMICAYNLQTNNEHISVETYYRFLIQRVLPEYSKVLYLDCDLVVLDDISKLWEIDLKNNLVAAARDADFLGNLNKSDGNRMRYAKNVLHMHNPYDYFQAGVLVLNLEQMRVLYSFEQWLEYATDSKYLYDDQDILNVHCEGRVLYLDNAWNVMNNCGRRIQNVCSYAPAEVYEKYLAAYKNPMIMHFAGFEKPWKAGGCDKDTLYWEYARETPFYEQQLSAFIASTLKSSKGKNAKEIDLHRIDFSHEPVIAKTNGLRKTLDPLLPLGSRRRELAKSIARAILRRK